MGKVRRLTSAEIREALKRDELKEGLAGISHWLKGHAENAVIGAILAALLGFGLYYWLSHRGESVSRASIQLSGADQQMSRALSGGGGQGLAQAEAAYQAIRAEFQGSGEGDASELGLAHAAFEQGKFDDARLAYESFSAAHPSSPLAGLAELSKAACLEALGKPKEAAEAYKAVAEKKGSGVEAQAWMDAARCFESLGDQANLGTALQKLAKLESEGSLPGSLKPKLRLLLKRQGKDQNS